MSMTIVVTRDVADRFSGFLASVMPEVAPGVYASPRLSKGVRERVWAVLGDWWGERPGGSILLVYRDEAAPGGLRILALGTPTRELADLDGVLVGKRKRRTEVETIENGASTSQT
jgi:CRISPR-associated protein Cas2